MGKKLAVYSLLTLIHLLGIMFCIYISLTGFPFLFITLTIFNFTLDTIYITMITYYELFAYHESKTYQFIKDTCFKFLFVLGMMVCTGYWGLVFLGDRFMPFQMDLMEILFSVYVHFIISVVIFLDLFVTEHKIVNDFKTDVAILTGFWIFYALLLVSMAKVFGINIYPFLNFHLKEIIMIYLVLFMFSFNFYQLFVYLVDSKSEKIVKARQYVTRKISSRVNIANLINEIK